MTTEQKEEISKMISRIEYRIQSAAESARDAEIELKVMEAKLVEYLKSTTTTPLQS